MQGLIGRKIGMTRFFDETSGKCIAVTVIHTGTNIVHQVKTDEKDGYRSAQLGFDTINEAKISKPEAGHFKKLGTEPTRFVKEFLLDSTDESIKPGDRFGVDVFENVKRIRVIGTSIGLGFAGAIKRHNFHRGRATHGGKSVRTRGSVGANTYPGRVWPGLKMAGHCGAERVTIRNIEVVGLNKEDGLVYLKGAVPGKSRGIVYLIK
jgi:large subunit ribosomal protein L3